MMLTPIQTTYAGCHFRSRIEARWAVFFDHLRLQWEYEPQGYKLPSGPYLPDFWLPTLATATRGAWFEVKPASEFLNLDRRWTELATASGHSVLVTRGLPSHAQVMGCGTVDDHDIEEIFGLETAYDKPMFDPHRRFCVCPNCGLIGAQFGGLLDRLWCGHVTDEIDGSNTPRIIAAFNAARSARFERDPVNSDFVKGW